jgi:hypothetical protein
MGREKPGEVKIPFAALFAFSIVVFSLLERDPRAKGS